MKKLLIFIILLTVSFATVYGDNTPPEKGYPLSGKVIDVDSEEPLAGALLKVEGTNIVIGTNSKGELPFLSVPIRFIRSMYRAWATLQERCAYHRQDTLRSR